MPRKVSANRPDKSQLSERQLRILTVIETAVSLRGYPPSIREIGDATGLRSTSSVAYQLKQLEKMGFLRRDPHKPRAVNVVSDAGLDRPETTNAPTDGLPAPQYVPLLGTIAAGIPITAEEHVEDYFPIPKELAADGDLFLLQVKGDSMVDAAILDGDYVLIRSQPSADDGEFVAALIDDEATVKELRRDGDGAWLLPHNKNYSRIAANRATIMGKVVSVLRRL